MVKIEESFCLTHPSGEDIYLYTLRNTKGTEVCITNYGAIITSFKIKQGDHSINNIVLGFDNVEEYLSDEYLAGCPYFGAAIGRYANRIGNGEFSIDGIKFFLGKNMAPAHLHGGYSGFDKKTWNCESYSTGKLILSYTSVDGEEGYPGNLHVKLLFELNNNNNELTYEFTATTDRPTIVNLTHHSYFNLNNGLGTIADHLIRINSRTILEQDKNFVVTGNTISVKNTKYNFMDWKKAGELWDEENGYDQTYELEKNDMISPAAEVCIEKSGIKLQVYTTEPTVHFYTGKWIPGLHQKNESSYGPFSGLCLETQKHPNSINIPHFPNTILRPGEVYHTKTKYCLIT
ncbi:MAG: aldose epimerase family protein [Chitinophagaceae bacterium]